MVSTQITNANSLHGTVLVNRVKNNLLNARGVRVLILSQIIQLQGRITDHSHLRYHTVGWNAHTRPLPASAVAGTVRVCVFEPTVQYLKCALVLRCRKLGQNFFNSWTVYFKYFCSQFSYDIRFIKQILQFDTSWSR